MSLEVVIIEKKLAEARGTIALREKQIEVQAQVLNEKDAALAAVRAQLLEARIALRILLGSHDCLAPDGTAEIPEHISASFDIGLAEAQMVIVALAAAPGTGVDVDDESQHRPETGSMRFGDDWAGVFIRGDQAAYYAEWLNDVDVLKHLPLISLKTLLQSCAHNYAAQEIKPFGVVVIRAAPGTGEGR